MMSDKKRASAAANLATSVMASVVLGLSSAQYSGAQEQRKVSAQSASVAKASAPRAAKAPAPAKIATQKRMRDPWEKPKPLVVRTSQ
jgi:hypothetical protein